MGTIWTVRVKTNGSRVVKSTGRVGIALDPARCCPCTPLVVASYVTNGAVPEKRCWDLRPYQNYRFSLGCHPWRLIETVHCMVHASGSIAGDGKLSNLPAEFCSTYLYEGFMELQVGCLNPDGSSTWPGSCP